jgi:alkylation response protein AidB-like acyl-CoA dehydrogenase
MDFEFDDATILFREEVRQFLAVELTSELDERTYRSGVSHDETFARHLGDRGWLGAGWAVVDHLGRSLNPYEKHVLIDELTASDSPNYAVITTELVIQVIRAVGTSDLREDIIPHFLRGEVVIALGMTEPDVGSDVASARTRARRDGDRWIIDGQKMFTTNAQVANYLFLVTRTRLDGPKHRSLTLFLLPLDRVGIEIQPLYTLSGERTNIVFLNNVVLEDRWRVGEVDAGWQALTLALQEEHSAQFSGNLARLVGHAEQWADSSGRGDDPDVQARLGRWGTELEIARLLELRTTWMEATNVVPLAEGPMSKLFSTEATVRAAENIAEMIGPDALRSRLDPTAIADGRIEHALRFSVGMTIYAGTSEIQRNIIAQHACELPRPS